MKMPKSTTISWTVCLQWRLLMLSRTSKIWIRNQRLSVKCARPKPRLSKLLSDDLFSHFDHTVISSLINYHRLKLGKIRLYLVARSLLITTLAWFAWLNQINLEKTDASLFRASRPGTAMGINGESVNHDPNRRTTSGYKPSGLVNRHSFDGCTINIITRHGDLERRATVVTPPPQFKRPSSAAPTPSPHRAISSEI